MFPPPLPPIRKFLAVENWRNKTVRVALRDKLLPTADIDSQAVYFVADEKRTRFLPRARRLLIMKCAPLPQMAFEFTYIRHCGEERVQIDCFSIFRARGYIKDIVPLLYVLLYLHIAPMQPIGV
jgi:hypothetical protein